MKLKAHQVEGFVKRPDPRVAVFLLYGPDQGQVAALAKKLMAGAVDDVDDPFAVTDTDAETLGQSPGRLVEEAQTLSLMGGGRAVRVRRADDADPRFREAFMNDLKDLLKAERVEARVVIEAGDLRNNAPLIKACEKPDTAAVLPCYREEGAGLADAIRANLRELGLNVEPDALEHLRQCLGADRAVTRRELEKLALYMEGSDSRTVKLEDAAANVGEGSAIELGDLAYAALLGDFAKARATLGRLLDEKEAPVRLARVVATTLNTLMPLSFKVASGTPANVAFRQARMFFKLERQVTRALETWPPEALAKAVALTAAAERSLKRTGTPDALILERLLLDLSAMAKQGRRMSLRER